MPRVLVTRGRVAASLVFVVAVVGFLYFGLPKLVGFGASFKRLGHGDARWLAAAAVLEFLSYASYVALFRVVFVHDSARISWKVSYQITMASVAATRFFAAAGAGGIALTAWALRRAGMEPRLVAYRLIAFLTLLYGVYMGALTLDGIGLYTHILPGKAPFAITIIPTIFALVVILAFLSTALLPEDLERLAASRAKKRGVIGAAARRLMAAPQATAVGVRTAISLVRTGDPRVLGAIGNWAFDIATLWACFHAFGYSPDASVVVMAYFVGWFGNALPLPGGVGGVEGGMIGAFSVFGVSVQGAVVAVLAYRAFSFWLPTLPGGVAYFQLRRTVRRWEADNASTPASSTQSAGEAV
ncbi:MAG: lysylphosphatidylglycerol synthase transmembrane domain-containing protein [Solirubrobacteraceae bacterium]